MIRSSAKETLIQRLLWNVIWTLLVRPFPRSLASKWEIFLLKLFGANIAEGCTIYSSAKIMLPKHLNMEENCVIADHVYIQNSAPFYMKKGSEVSQYSYVCDGSHVIDNPEEGFDRSIILGERCWIGADSFIAFGVTIGRGCIIGACSVVRQSTPPYSVVMGNPAKVISFAREVDDILEYEKDNYAESERISEEVLKRNYQKYFVKKIKDIKQFVSL